MLLFQFLLSTSTTAATTTVFTRVYVSGTVLHAWPTGAGVNLTAELCLMCCCDSFLQCGLANWPQVLQAMRAGLQAPRVTWSHSEFLLSLPSAANTLPYTCPSDISASETSSPFSGYSSSTCDHPLSSPCTKS